MLAFICFSSVYLQVCILSFALGISLGIAGACVIVLLGYMYRSHLESSEEKLEDESHNARDADEEDQALETGIEVTDLVEHDDEETQKTESISAFTFDISAVRLDDRDNQSNQLLDTSFHKNQAPNDSLLLSHQSSASYEHFLALGMSVREARDRVSQMFPDVHNSEMVHAASFSSSNGSFDDDIQHADSYPESFHASMFDGSTDELDNYKNQNIEVFREAVEQAVYDVEGMMMLAVTNAWTQSPSSSAIDQDYSAFEAECLYQSFDWWKRHEHSAVDFRKEYFQELLNRVVSLVFYNKMPPLQGAQIVHGCATIIGLPLLRTLPQTTIIIQGMLKTNNLALGQKCIKKAFKLFGDIDSAAVATDNHGFGK
jgi:hypothetical protein